MSYLLISVFTDKVTDWKSSFDIVKRFLKHLENQSRLLQGFSYNNYFGGDTLFAHFEFRCNFSDDEKGKALAAQAFEDLGRNQLILFTSDWTPFVRREAVIKACEVSTRCALAFKNWMDAHPDVFGKFYEEIGSRRRFMTKFMGVFLQKLGFKASILSHDIDDDYLNTVNAVAEYVAKEGKPLLPKTMDVDFMERFMHHFCNCVYVHPQMEAEIYRELMVWSWLGSLLG